MKRITIYFRQFFILTFLVICFLNEVHAQVTDTTKRKIPGLFIGVSIGPSQTNIKNEGTLSISKLLSDPRSSFFGNVAVGYFFSKYIGISSGVGYLSYRSRLSLDAYQNTFNTIDSENDAYEMSVTGSGIKELQTVDFLTIPLCMNFRLPISKKVGMFLKGGVDMTFPLNQKYASSGVFTYKGYYPAYNDVLENLPAYGFPTNKNVISEGQLKMKTVGVNSIASAGLDFDILKKMQIGLGVNYSHSLLKEANSSNPELASPVEFQLSPDAEHINSFVGGSSKIAAQSLGIEITFRFYLR